MALMMRSLTSFSILPRIAIDDLTDNHPIFVCLFHFCFKKEFGQEDGDFCRAGDRQHEQAIGCGSSTW